MAAIAFVGFSAFFPLSDYPGPAPELQRLAVLTPDNPAETPAEQAEDDQPPAGETADDPAADDDTATPDRPSVERVGTPRSETPQVPPQARAPGAIAPATPVAPSVPRNTDAGAPRPTGLAVGGGGASQPVPEQAPDVRTTVVEDTPETGAPGRFAAPNAITDAPIAPPAPPIAPPLVVEEADAPEEAAASPPEDATAGTDPDSDPGPEAQTEIAPMESVAADEATVTQSPVASEVAPVQAPAPAAEEVAMDVAGDLASDDRPIEATPSEAPDVASTNDSAPETAPDANPLPVTTRDPDTSAPAETVEEAPIDLAASSETATASDQQPAPASASATPGSEEEALPPTPVADGPAWRAFAAGFTRESERPLLSIILIDVGEEGLPLDSLIGIDAAALPITFALRPGGEATARRAWALRDAGFEVVALIDSGKDAVAPGRSSEEIAADLSKFAADVPGAVGFLDAEEGALPSDNRLAETVLAALAPSGHLLVTHGGSGLINNVSARAAAAGVPSATAVRMIDVRPEAGNIKAQLDGALRSAITAGSAVVVGRTRPETVTTLYSWLLSSRGRSIEVAPISGLIAETADAS
ncbi:MAG: divergent polysaccharide deacetylase family protein [Pseudomonadota bacterium]